MSRLNWTVSEAESAAQHAPPRQITAENTANRSVREWMLLIIGSGVQQKADAWNPSPVNRTIMASSILIPGHDFKGLIRASHSYRACTGPARKLRKHCHTRYNSAVPADNLSVGYLRRDG